MIKSRYALILMGTLANSKLPVEAKRVLILFTGLIGVPGYVFADEGMRTARAPMAIQEALEVSII